MNFLKGKGGELVELASQSGVKIDDECQFAFIPEHVARLLSYQVQRWAVDADCFEADAYISEFTPAGDLSDREEQALFTTNSSEWLEIASELAVIADKSGTFIIDLAELDEALWCEALLCVFGDDAGVMAGHGFNLAMMLKHQPQKFLAVCQEAAFKYTSTTAERIFDASVGEWLEELKHGD